MDYKFNKKIFPTENWKNKYRDKDDEYFNSILDMYENEEDYLDAFYPWRKKYTSNGILNPNDFEFEEDYLNELYPWRKKYTSNDILNPNDFEFEEDYLKAKERYSWRENYLYDKDFPIELYETEEEYLEEKNFYFSNSCLDEKNNDLKSTIRLHNPPQMENLRKRKEKLLELKEEWRNKLFFESFKYNKEQSDMKNMFDNLKLCSYEEEINNFNEDSGVLSDYYIILNESYRLMHLWRNQYKDEDKNILEKYELETDYLEKKYKWREKYKYNEKFNLDEYETEFEFLKKQFGWRENYITDCSSEQLFHPEDFDFENDYLEYKKYVWREKYYDIFIDYAEGNSPDDFETEEDFLINGYKWREKYKDEISFMYINLYEDENDYLRDKEKLEIEILYDYSLDEFEQSKLDYHKKSYDCEYKYYLCNSIDQYEKVKDVWNYINCLSAQLVFLEFENDDLIIHLKFVNALEDYIRFIGFSLKYYLYNRFEGTEIHEDTFSFFIDKKSEMFMKVTYGSKNPINQYIKELFSNYYRVSLEKYSYVKNTLTYNVDLVEGEFSIIKSDDDYFDFFVANCCLFSYEFNLKYYKNLLKITNCSFDDTIVNIHVSIMFVHKDTNKYKVVEKDFTNSIYPGMSVYIKLEEIYNDSYDLDEILEYSYILNTKDIHGNNYYEVDLLEQDAYAKVVTFFDVEEEK